jgi:hypothetical protein
MGPLEGLPEQAWIVGITATQSVRIPDAEFDNYLN